MYLRVSNVSQTPCLTISPLPHVSQSLLYLPVSHVLPFPTAPRSLCKHVSRVSYVSYVPMAFHVPTILLMHPYLPESLLTVNPFSPCFPVPHVTMSSSPPCLHRSPCAYPTLFHLSPRGRSPADTSGTMFTTSDTSDTSDTGPDILLTFRRHCPHRDFVGRVPPLAVN